MYYIRGASRAYVSVVLCGGLGVDGVVLLLLLWSLRLCFLRTPRGEKEHLYICMYVCIIGRSIKEQYMYIHMCMSFYLKYKKKIMSTYKGTSL